MKMMNKPFPQECTITKERATIEKYGNGKAATGYKIHGAKDEMLGVVIPDPKYLGRAVIRFCNEIKSQYGVWHLIQENYKFAYLQGQIEKNGSIKLLVD